MTGARTGLVGLEQLSDEQLHQLQEQFEKIRHASNGDVSKPVVQSIEHERRKRSSKNVPTKGVGKSKHTHNS